MSDYFSASVALTANTAALIADVSTKDREAHVSTAGTSISYGFSNTTAVFFPAVGELLTIPAGEQLWAITTSGGLHAVVFVTKPAASISLCN